MKQYASGKPHLAMVLGNVAGGGPRVILNLAEVLIKRGYQIDLVMDEFTGDYRSAIPQDIRLYRLGTRRLNRELLAYCRERGIQVNALMPNPAAVVWTWIALNRMYRGFRVRKRHALYAYIVARYLRRVQPKLLFSAVHNSNAAAVYASELTGGSIPVIASIHSDADRYTGDQPLLARSLYSRVDAVVAVSKGVAGSVSQLLEVGDERIHTIHNPIPHNEILDLAQYEVSHRWFRGGEPPVLLSVGRENRAKDYPTLVEAFGMLRGMLRARLVIMGRFSDSYKAELVSQARGYGVEGDFGFLDFDENPYRYMRRAALVVSSSYREGLPTVLIEALACGTPVVSTEARHGPSEILDGGRWGKLTPVRDAPALAQAMVEVLRGDRPTEEALLRRAADFSSERAADAYVELFEKVMARRESR